MAKSVLSAPHFLDEPAAFAYVESRLWPNGPVCPHCGETARIGRLNGKTTRPGLHKCYACKKPFTVRMGTIFEDSHLPLHLWLQVIHLFCAARKASHSANPAHAQLQHEDRVVPWPSYPAGYGPWHGNAYGRAGKTVEADEMEMGRSQRRAAGPKAARAM